MQAVSLAAIATAKTLNDLQESSETELVASSSGGGLGTDGVLSGKGVS